MSKPNTHAGVIRRDFEALTEREARYADTAFQTWDGQAAAEGEWRGGTWGEVARAVMALADEEIEARVFDDFKHSLAAKDTIIADRVRIADRLQGCLDMYTAANTEALKAITRLYAEAEDERAAYGFLEVEVAEQIAKVNERGATIDRVRALAYAWAPFKDDGHPHWAGCHLVHADCFIYAIRAALEPTP